MSRLATWTKTLGKFISSLRGALSPRAVFPRGDGAWTQIDAQNLKAFLASTSGARLNAKLNNMLTESAINGAADTTNTVHCAGVTTGVTSTLRYLYSLTYTFDKQRNTHEERVENAEQRAERELLERIGAL